MSGAAVRMNRRSLPNSMVLVFFFLGGSSILRSLGERRRTRMRPRNSYQGSGERYPPLATSIKRRRLEPLCARAQPDGTMVLLSRTTGAPTQSPSPTQRGRPRLPVPALRGQYSSSIPSSGRAATSALAWARGILRFLAFASLFSV